LRLLLPLSVERPVLAGLAVVLVAGCGDSGPSFPVANLAGSVSIDGAPVAQGNINFIPTGPQQAPATMAKIVDGRYDARNVPLGTVLVRFSAGRETGEMNTEHDAPFPIVENLIPEAYWDGIEVDVTGDDPQRDFDLRSQRK
jgi:hypothetical protein